MGFAAALFLLPAQIKQHPELKSRKGSKRMIRSASPVARLFGPAIFEASKLKVMYLGVDEGSPKQLPRAYTLTHSDVTSKLTLAVSHTVNRAQLAGWYNKLQRDEVVAEWRRVQGRMSLHVHCHISGGHFLLDLVAGLRHYIFARELPVVLKAFVHGDGSLFACHPELEDALVWVYFHSNLPEFNRVECWGPLRDAGEPRVAPSSTPERPRRCAVECECCFPSRCLVPWPQEEQGAGAGQLQQ